MGAFRILDKAELWISNGCLAALVIVLSLQVFCRYVLEVGLSWSEETSRFLFIWFVYVSASLAARAGTHVRVTAFVDLAPCMLKRPIRILADCLWIGFNLLVVVSGLMLFRQMIRYPVYSTSLYLPLSYIYLIIPLAHALIVLRICQRLGNWEPRALQERHGAASASAYVD